MAPELSQNWKILQARLKAGSTSTSSASSSSSPSQTKTSKPAPKRKASDEPARDTNKKLKQAPKPKPNPKNLKAARTIAKPSPLTKGKMGAAHSTLSPLNAAPSTTVPSLQLLTSKHDISAESLAEAYSLGVSSSTLKSLPTVPNQGLSPDVSVESLGKYLAIDCEMVGVGPGGYESALARVSITDFHGKQVYDSYVVPRERVTDWRTHVSGIQAKHMHTARTFQEVQGQVAELLKGGRIVVGHDVKHDLKALELDHSSKMIRDTAKFSGFKKYGHGPKPALKVLAKEILGLDIQQGQHSSVEDARVAMLLFRRHKSAFDVEHANRYPDEAKGKPKVNFKGKAKKAKRG
ncbi:putative RNA exonuclease 4 [Cladorrhinum samala]|uniref:RNA exonuclease 4 n=1 Tax=Cladorrhinum samala TaxID=585594 RepID=A0AAV9HGB3_9PEZI|nr:putative RNA exonuclease 4 [Cladorrhinum samala]